MHFLEKMITLLTVSVKSPIL